MATFSMSANTVGRAADSTSGSLAQKIAGEAITQYDWLYTDTDGTVKKAVNTSQAAATVTHMAMASAASGEMCTCLIVSAGNAFTASGLTADTQYVVSSTAGLAEPAADLSASDHIFTLFFSNSTTAATMNPVYVGTT